jgi:hypothetical protein
MARFLRKCRRRDGDDQSAKEREELIRLLTLLNSSVNFIALQLSELAGNKVLAPDYLQRLAAVTREVETYLSKSSNTP